MMETNNGESLIKLLDDPDELVYEAVSRKIREVGPGLLPELESVARETMTPILHTRIELIIKLLQFTQLKTDLDEWIHSPAPRLLSGAWLMSRFQFPDLTEDQFTRMIKPLKDEIWLEISERLTAIEKIRVMNTLVYGKRKVHMNESHPESPGNNFINRILETGKANEHSLSLLYAVIAQELMMPVFIVDMPEYPVLSYMDAGLVPEGINDPGLFEILFYINPADSGSLHSRDDITNFLIRHSFPLEPLYYEPRTNPDCIRICLERLYMDYDNSGSSIRKEQVEELLTLWK
jgi:hypothetical protein